MQVGKNESEQISNAALCIRQRLQRGGKLILFGNGGSATDANDWAIDCILPPTGYQPIPAVSLSFEPATITAVGDDVGHRRHFSAGVGAGGLGFSLYRKRW